MGRLLIFLSGAQSDILDSVQTDRAKYQGVGFSILFTGILACVSMCFALHTALSASLAWAVVAGVGWAFLIIGIDRMLVVSMVPRHGARNVLLVILPRLLLALLLSIVISTPIVLEIFKPEIDQEITAIHQQQVSAAARTAQNDQVGQEITTLNKDIASLTPFIASTASQIASLTKQYQSEESALQAANAQYQCQISGGPGCVAGNGPLAKTAAGNGQADQQKAAAILAQIGRLQNDPATLDRQRQLTSDQAQLKTYEAEQTTATTQASQATFRDTGILIRLQALGQVAARSTTVQAARWLVFALFVVFECMPVLSKVLLNAAGTATYDQALAFDQGIQLQVANRMSSDRLADADSTIAERDRIRTALARRRAPRPRRPWRPGWSLPRARRPRGSGWWPWPRRPRGPGWWPWPRRRAVTWEPWASFPRDTADQTADGSQLPPVFLREPVPGTPDGQPGGTP